MIDNTYQPADVEDPIYASGEAAGTFRAGRPRAPGGRALQQHPLARAEMNITMATEVSLVLVGVSAETSARAGCWTGVIRRLARLSQMSLSPSVPPGAVQLVGCGEVVALPLVGVIDFAAEEARLQQELARAKSDIARVDAKFATADFMRHAAEEVVEGEREKREEAEGRCRKLEEALERLRGAADLAPPS